MTQSTKTVPIPRFNELGISPALLQILEKRYSTPTPIQAQIIPTALSGRDVIGIAQTGTGKTLAFGVPLLQRLAQTGGQALIILPTRELALQVNDMLQKIGQPFNLKTAVIIGGASAYHQIQMIHRLPQVVIATPGRLVDHLQRKTYSLKKVKIIVLDEADRMLDIGFSPQIKRILQMAPEDRQTMLFSATMPQEIAQLAAAYLKNPFRVDASPSGTTVPQIEQGVYLLNHELKLPMLDKVLQDETGTILVFTRTKRGATKVTRQVQGMGHSASEIHSNRSFGQRKEALEGFKSGKYRVLVATDIASRGIDVQHISLVLNYDLPDNTEDYVHRIGRTGRAGKKGKALSFALYHEQSDVRAIERLIKKTIPALALPVSFQNKAPISFNKPSFNDRRPSRRLVYGFKKRFHNN